jgi:hypothetical protein
MDLQADAFADGELAGIRPKGGNRAYIFDARRRPAVMTSKSVAQIATADADQNFRAPGNRVGLSRKRGSSGSPRLRPSSAQVWEVRGML